MVQLEDAIEKSEKDKLLDGIIKYQDTIPASSEEMGRQTNLVMKMLEGVASVEEVRSVDKESAIAKLYKKYLLNEQDADGMRIEDGDIDDGDIDDLIELKLLISSDSVYCEKLDKLIFRICFEKTQGMAQGMAQEIYKKYDWAKELIQKKYFEIEESLVFREEAEEYKKKFGTDPDPLSEASVEQGERNNLQVNNKKDSWISLKFGGKMDG